MFSALSNKATASPSRVDVGGSDGHGERVVSKNSAYLSQLATKLVIVFGASFSSPKSRITLEGGRRTDRGAL
jgi:hypothetical protein